jgi:cytochrome c556
LPLPQPPGLRPLMLIMDGIHADAKKAMLVGRVDDAKKQAIVLAELGQLVSHSRQASSSQADAWKKLSGEFVESAQAVAASPATDAAAVRQLLKNVSQRCEACHETRTR